MFRRQHGLAGHVLGGWAVAGTYIIASGQPYTPVQAFLPGNTGVEWMDSTFNSAFFSYPSVNVRPFYGNPNAPISNVGIYAGDMCNYDGVVGCNLPASTMLSYNLMRLVIRVALMSYLPTMFASSSMGRRQRQFMELRLATSHAIRYATTKRITLTLPFTRRLRSASALRFASTSRLSTCLTILISARSIRSLMMLAIPPTGWKVTALVFRP